MFGAGQDLQRERSHVRHGPSVLHGRGRPPPLRLPGHGPDRYEKEVDVVDLAPGSDVRAWTDDGAPLAWVAGDRAAVLLASVRASDVCPVTSPQGEEALGQLLVALVESITR